MTSIRRTNVASVSEHAPPHQKNWRRLYARNLRITDFFVLVWVVYGTQIAWLGFDNASVTTGRESTLPEVSYWFFSTGLIVVWMWALALIDSRSDRVVGTGNTEYVRVVRASFVLFGAIAIVAFLLKVEVARGYLLISLPAGTLMLVLVRWVWRQWLVSKRLRGEYSARLLLVGSQTSVAQIAHELSRNLGAGYRVVGACVPSGQCNETIPGTQIPVLGSVDDIPRAMAETKADTVAVTSIGDLPPQKVKQISWGLEAGRQHLVLAPSITDIAGPRIQTRPVSGLPLIHVETPRFSSGERFAKRLLDIVLSMMGIVLTSPLIIVLAILVKITSTGPVLFRQNRVGYHGREFPMLKFRSMVVNAEELLSALQQSQDAGNEVMFKMTNDPRVTRIGRVMRRFSLDELPQLLNVLGGSMSLVGPRPPLPNEVARYAGHVHRRFLVKPGVTGLWQVSGRSTLSWEDSVRLDLYYVENWSLIGDIGILFKTFKAVSFPGETAH